VKKAKRHSLTRQNTSKSRLEYERSKTPIQITMCAYWQH